MIEVVAALAGAIIGSMLTLVYSSVHETNELKREREIIRKTLLAECALQHDVLNVLEVRYKEPQSVNPARFALDIFEYALKRHLSGLGDVVLIQKLSQLVIKVRALNMALDRYEPELMKALAETRRIPNVERMRLGICKSIQLCKKSLHVVCLALQNDDDRKSYSTQNTALPSPNRSSSNP